MKKADRQLLSSSESRSRAETFDHFRDELVNSILIVAAIVAMITVAISFFRLKDVGWRNVMFVHVFCYLALLAATIFRRRLSLNIRVTTLIAIGAATGIGGLITWGFNGMGLSLLFLCCVLIVLFYGVTAGIFATVALMLLISVIGVCIVQGWLTLNIDFNAYIVARSAWMTAAMSAGLFASVTVIAIGRIQGFLIQSLERLIHRTKELENANERLKMEIGSRQASEDALRRSEERYRAITEKAVDGIFCKDLERRFTFVNPAAAYLIGHPVEKILGRAPEEIFDAGNAAIIAEVDRVAYAGQIADEIRTLHIGPEKKILHTIQVPMYDAHGQITGITGIVRDITAQKLAEMELNRYRENLEEIVRERTDELDRANRELQNLNAILSAEIDERRQTQEKLRETQEQIIRSEKMAALGGLVAGIAHEINTPIGIGVTSSTFMSMKVRACLDLLEKSETADPALLKNLRKIADAAQITQTNMERAAEIVSEFKRVAVDQSNDQQRAFNLCEYIHVILFSLKFIHRDNRHSVMVNCADDLVITANPGAFFQILTNLIVNAFVHAFEDGKPGIVAIDAQRSNDQVVLKCRDNGKGMDAETLRQVFNPFFTTKRHSGGTGLGLHIVYNLVTQTLQGQIDCTSSPGAGTEFVITFPAA